MPTYETGPDKVTLLNKKYGKELGRLEWFKEVIKFYENASLCDRVRMFGPPIEAFNNQHGTINAIEEINLENKSNEQIVKEVSRISSKSKYPRKEYTFGLHESKNPSKVVKTGFREGKGDTYATSPLRESAVFFWIHSINAGEMHGRGQSNVVVASKRKNTMVSSFMNYSILEESSLEPINYDKYHVVKYENYADCIRRGKTPSGSYNTKTLLNEL